MWNRLATAAVAALGVAVLLAPAVAQQQPPRENAVQQIDNPEYQAWSGARVGSLVRYGGVVEEEGLRTEAELSVKLIDLKHDRARLEMTAVLMKDGKKTEIVERMTRDVPAMLRVIPKRTEAGEVGNGSLAFLKHFTPQLYRDAYRDVDDRAENAEVRESYEALILGGREFRTRVIERIVMREGRRISLKSWFDYSIPSGLVKLTQKTEGGPTVSLVLLDWMT